jgi:hypothetical protein
MLESPPVANTKNVIEGDHDGKNTKKETTKEICYQIMAPIYLMNNNLYDMWFYCQLHFFKNITKKQYGN